MRHSRESGKKNPHIIMRKEKSLWHRTCKLKLEGKGVRKMGEWQDEASHRQEMIERIEAITGLYIDSWNWNLWTTGDIERLLAFLKK